MTAIISIVAGLMIIFGVSLTVEVLKYIAAGCLILWGIQGAWKNTIHPKMKKRQIEKQKEETDKEA